MEIGEPTSKTLKKMRQKQQKMRYLTRHLPLVNDLLNDLAVLHPLMLKEDLACQVIRRTVKKLSQIRLDYVGQFTDEWKKYKGQEIPEDGYITGHQGDGSNTEKLTTTGNDCSRHKTLQAHHTSMSC